MLPSALSPRFTVNNDPAQLTEKIIGLGPLNPFLVQRFQEDEKLTSIVLGIDPLGRSCILSNNVSHHINSSMQEISLMYTATNYPNSINLKLPRG